MTAKYWLRENTQPAMDFASLPYMKEMGMGNDRYHLIDIDNDDAEITLADAVKDVVPFEG